jgi:ATP-dependent RNA helicase DeaD
VTKSFEDLGLSEDTLQALRDVGYESPSPIQEQAIPPMLEGRDVIGQAQTGSGKTAAFGLPIVEYVDPVDNEVQALVLTPTRELCIQVTRRCAPTASARASTSSPRSAARRSAPSRRSCARRPDRRRHRRSRDGPHVARVALHLSSCRFVVLDEADEMLDLGFLEDVEKILAQTPNRRQTALFSATMPPPIRKLADRYLYDPEHVKVKAATLTVDSVEQFQLEVKGPDKQEKLLEVLQAERPDQAIVFVRTKIRTEQLFRKLRDGGMNVKALHGDMSQGARDGVMLGFKGGRVPVLVATDVAARGLDISTVTHVINYDVPTSPDVYVHRIGRTGRVGRSGRAITFVEPRQRKEAEAIEAHIGTTLSPWIAGAHVAPERIEAPPRRHTKPQVNGRRREGEPERRFVTLIAAGGSADGVEVSDLVHAVTSAAQLDGEAVRDVTVLTRFSLLHVPETEAERIVTALAGQRLEVELARN